LRQTMGKLGESYRRESDGRVLKRWSYTESASMSATSRPIVLLKTEEGNRYLPIWIGHPEAAAILMKLQNAELPRPMTHDLLMSILGHLEAKLEAGVGHRVARQHLLRHHQPGDRRGQDGRRLAAVGCHRTGRSRGRTHIRLHRASDSSGIEFEQEVEDAEEVVEGVPDSSTTSPRGLLAPTPPPTRGWRFPFGHAHH